MYTLFGDVSWLTKITSGVNALLCVSALVWDYSLMINTKKAKCVPFFHAEGGLSCAIQSQIFQPSAAGLRLRVPKSHLSG